jgi:hypothetical protein
MRTAGSLASNCPQLGRAAALFVALIKDPSRRDLPPGEGLGVAQTHVADAAWLRTGLGSVFEAGLAMGGAGAAVVRF